MDSHYVGDYTASTDDPATAIIRTDMSISPQHGSIPLLIRLTRSVYKRASEDVLGMKLKAYMSLSSLRERGEMPQAELCAAMHLDPNNCVLMLNDMEGARERSGRRGPH